MASSVASAMSSLMLAATIAIVAAFAQPLTGQHQDLRQLSSEQQLLDGSLSALNSAQLRDLNAFVKTFEANLDGGGVQLQDGNGKAPAEALVARIVLNSLLNGAGQPQLSLGSSASLEDIDNDLAAVIAAEQDAAYGGAGLRHWSPGVKRSSQRMGAAYLQGAPGIAGAGYSMRGVGGQRPVQTVYAKNAFDFGLGKRPDTTVAQRYSGAGVANSALVSPASGFQSASQYGKRPSTNRFDFGLGKRVTSYPRYDFGLGKRAII